MKTVLTKFLSRVPKSQVKNQKVCENSWRVLEEPLGSPLKNPETPMEFFRDSLGISKVRID
jgi:hypothetical protein